MLPETDVTLAQLWVAQHNDRLPAQARDQLRYEVDVQEGSLTVLECRAPWGPEHGPEWTRSPIARVRYTKMRKEWSIECPDGDLEFHRYDLFTPAPGIEAARDEIDRDPTSIFWG